MINFYGCGVPLGITWLEQALKERSDLLTVGRLSHLSRTPTVPCAVPTHRLLLQGNTAIWGFKLHSVIAGED